ncbi:MAG TPA: family 1 encapsulin nanocompartment shell protein [Jatrophihabitans sp.]|nr:family 1 encapsulin nanocompartment shell protein [Jatrophihabitans sp.]
MNNLHRELAPISAAAWSDLEDEVRRTFKRHVAARRIVDVPEPAGTELGAVSTGHLDPVDAPSRGLLARVRRTQPIVELRATFTLDREQVDSVERGARDADWQPAKDAAWQIAAAEDRAVFDGYSAARIAGIRPSSSHPALALPADVRTYPDVVSQAMSNLRLAGVDGPYTLVLSAEAYTAASETADYGYPVRRHLEDLLDGEILWAPALDGAALVSGRGGDFELRIGQDLSIGYASHDATSVTLYLEETFTFLVYTPEAAVSLPTAVS